MGCSPLDQYGLVVSAVLSQSKARLTLAHVAVLLILGYAYYNYVAPMFAYQRFEMGFVFWRLIVSIAILSLLILSVDNRKLVSPYLNHIAILTIVTPSLVLFYAGNGSIKFILVTCLCFLTVSSISRLSLKSLPQPASIPPRKMLLYTTLATGGMTVAIAWMSGLSAPNFNLSAVYELREEIGEGTGDIYSYLETIVSKSILTMAVALACVYRQRIAVILLCVVAILMFGFTTHKSMALYPFLVIGVYFAASKQNRMALFVWGVAGITAIAALDTWLYLNNHASTEAWLLSLLTRRSLMVPAKLNSEYIEIFSVTQAYYWSNNRIAFGLLEQPYDMGPARLVASILTGREYSANTGWIGSGYAQAGLGGALLYSVILGFVFSVLDRCAARINPRIVAAAAIVPVFSALTATDLLTALMTHGLGLTVLMLLIIAPTKQVPHRINILSSIPQRRGEGGVTLATECK